MPNIMNINSGKGVVTFSHEDLIEYDLIKWIRTSHKGAATQKLLSDGPFEKAAAYFYREQFPSQQVKLAEKVMLLDDSSVEVVLRVADENATGYYNQHPTKVVIRKQEKTSAEG